MKLSIITSLYASEKFLDLYFQRLGIFEKKLEELKIENEIEIVLVFNDINSQEKKIFEKYQYSFKKIVLQSIKTNRETIYSSWNRGVKYAKSEVICFWNVDDNRNVDAIIDGLSLINDGLDIVYFDFFSSGIRWYKRIIPYYKKRLHSMPVFDRKLFSNSMCLGPFFMFRKSIVDLIGLFDEQFRIAGDFDFAVRAALNNKVKFAKSLVNGGTFYVHGGNLSGYNNFRQQVENQVVYTRYNAVEKLEDLSQKQTQLFNTYKI